MKTSTGTVRAILGLLVMAGCATASHQSSLSSSNNELLIENSSPYTLLVERKNGEPWMENKQPVRVLPKNYRVLKNCSQRSYEGITLEFKAVREIRAGCLVGTEPIGSHEELVAVGRDVPGTRIILTGHDF